MCNIQYSNILNLEIGDECYLSQIWDGNGEEPEKNWAVWANDDTYIVYEFKILEIFENDKWVKITDVYFV